MWSATKRRGVLKASRTYDGHPSILVVLWSLLPSVSRMMSLFPTQLSTPLTTTPLRFTVGLSQHQATSTPTLTCQWKHVQRGKHKEGSKENHRNSYCHMQTSGNHCRRECTLRTRVRSNDQEAKSDGGKKHYGQNHTGNITDNET